MKLLLHRVDIFMGKILHIEWFNRKNNNAIWKKECETSKDEIKAKKCLQECWKKTARMAFGKLDNFGGIKSRQKLQN